jgi:hypothetical protein
LLRSIRIVLVLPDLAIPFHNQKALRNLLRFAQELNPNQIVTVGDFIAPNRPDAERECLAVLEQIRSAYDGPIGVHVRQPQAAAGANDPDTEGGMQVPPTDLTGLLSEFEITKLPLFYDIAPGWLSTHGDAHDHAKYAGGKAIAIARQKDKSVVCGDSHRIASIGVTTGEAGKQITVWGMEIGHLTDMKKAGYSPEEAKQAQRGFGILEISETAVNPVSVPIKPNGSFVYGGTTYA